MIVIYYAAPGYDPASRSMLSVSGFADVHRWAATRKEAVHCARQMAQAIGERPKPGIQHSEPIRISIMERSYPDLVHLAAGDFLSEKEVGFVWQLAKPIGSHLTQHWTESEL